MEQRNFIYRREGSDELVEIPASEAPEQDFAGFVVLPDGTVARRCLYLELERDGKPPKSTETRAEDFRPIASDALGFSANCLEEMREHRDKTGQVGVNFVPDEKVPEWYHVECSSRRIFNEYAKSRGFVQRSGIGGVRLSEEEFERARNLVNRVYSK